MDEDRETSAGTAARPGDATRPMPRPPAGASVGPVPTRQPGSVDGPAFSHASEETQRAVLDSVRTVGTAMRGVHDAAQSVQKSAHLNGEALDSIRANIALLVSRRPPLGWWKTVFAIAAGILLAGVIMAVTAWLALLTIFASVASDIGSGTDTTDTSQLPGDDFTWPSDLTETP